MKEYDLITIGTGSAMSIVDLMLQENPSLKIAVIDKDEPGGICLTRGCIPSKILLYPAEMVKEIGKAAEFGIDAEIKKIDFEAVMNRMRRLINKDIQMIRQGLSNSKNVDYYPTVAEFVAPYTLKVGSDEIRSDMIFLCTGSRPMMPRIKGLGETGYHTSDTLLGMSRLPESFVVIGGGYIASEYGHFLSAMGSHVTIIGRSSRMLPDEEPEVSEVVRRNLEKQMTLITGYEVVEADLASDGKKRLVAVSRNSGEKKEVVADEILVAAGRGPNTDLLHPERGGIETDEKGWIVVDDYLETSQSNIWALGDANGKYLFKHVANYEAKIVYYNAVLKEKMKVDYHAVPHAVFTYPEVAAVGFKEKQAVDRYGKDKVLIGAQRYEDVAKGEAMNAKDFFVKVIVERETMRILGAHIVGPNASILIQEIINLMYTSEQTATPIIDGMHIHPALSEVVERAFNSLMPPEQYHHMMEHHYGIPFNPTM